MEMRKLSNKRGQSTLEYAVLIVVIIGALLAMQVYVKRGVQGKLRESTDSIGDQFSPGYTTYNKTTHSYSATNEEQNATQSTTTIGCQVQQRNMEENVADAGKEYWSDVSATT
jgi:uncharacterized protein (UPF0333 family)